VTKSLNFGIRFLPIHKFHKSDINHKTKYIQYASDIIQHPEEKKLAQAVVHPDFR